jgi:hypothetical protein
MTIREAMTKSELVSDHLTMDAAFHRLRRARP